MHSHSHQVGVMGPKASEAAATGGFGLSVILIGYRESLLSLLVTSLVGGRARGCVYITNKDMACE